jgi:hypothetical protein
MAMLDVNALSVSGHPLSQDATGAERRAYRENVLHLPGPVDRWLTANSRSPRIMFLRDYLMLTDVQTEYVTCRVKRVSPKVSAIVMSDLPYSLHKLVTNLNNLNSQTYTCCTSRRRHRLRAQPCNFFKQVLKLC